MSIHSEFYKDANFGGYMESFDSSWRYFWIKFGSNLSNEVSSFRSHAYNGAGANCYAMTDNNFLGNYASLNVPNGYTCWWSYVGSAMNDDIESALMINRSANETMLELKDLIAGDFASGLDAKLAGTQVSREGDPKVYSTFFPGYDPGKNFVSIEQNLHVTLDWWPDYEAQVRYDVYLYVDGNGHINGYVAWVYVWVEGGIFSSHIFNELQPKLVAGASTLTEMIQSKLTLFGSFRFSGLYLLPGPKPTSAIGETGDCKSNSTLVLVP